MLSRLFSSRQVDWIDCFTLAKEFRQISSHRNTYNRLKMLAKQSLVISLLVLLADRLPIGRAEVEDVNCPTEVHMLAEDTTADTIRLRGYSASNHKVTTSDGYILNLVQATNPLVKEPTKEPLLLVHGTHAFSKMFCAVPDNHTDILVKDYSDKNSNHMSDEELNSLLADDPASQSLVWLALNFGHHVWLLDRRGSAPSLGHTDPDQQASLPANGADRVSRDLLQDMFGDEPLRIKSTQYAPTSRELDSLAQTINPKFWNFSLDEQAKYDIPEVTDFILNQSQFQKLIYVGHSAGSTIALAALIETPELADKFSKILLWAPPFYRNCSSSQESSKRTRALRAFTGPFVPPKALYDLHIDMSCNCVTPEQQHKDCPTLEAKSSGPLGDQVSIGPEVASIYSSVSVGEFIQNSLRPKPGKLHKFDYGTERANLEHYGQKDPPEYDASKIVSKSISLWYGANDIIASEEMVQLLLSELKVPVELFRIGNSSVEFSHSSFFVEHKQKAHLLSIPSLKFMQST